MKRLIILAIIGIVVTQLSCSDKKGTDNDPNPPDSNWSVAYGYNMVGSMPVSLLLESNTIYGVGNAGALFVFDVSESDTIKLVGTIPPEVSSNKVTVGRPVKRGNLVYATHQTAWNSPSVLEVFDVSTAASPVSIGSIQSSKISPMLSDEYHQFTGLSILSDTLLVHAGLLSFVYRITGANSFVALDTFVWKDIAEPTCLSGWASMFDHDGQYLYIFGECTQTALDDQFWLLSRTNRSEIGYLDMSALAQLNGGVQARHFSSAVYFWESPGINRMAEVNASNPSHPAFVTMRSLFYDLPLYGNDKFQLGSIYKAGSNHVLLGTSVHGGVILCDNNFGFLKINKDITASDVIANATHVFMATSHGLMAFPLP